MENAVRSKLNTLALDTEARRKALVVGFSRYHSTLDPAVYRAVGVSGETPNDPFRNCANDAFAMAGRLETQAGGANFEVTRIIDIDEEGCHLPTKLTWRSYLLKVTRQFFADSTSRDTLLFYYSGHGCKEKGHPCFAVPRNPETGERDLLPFEDLLDIISHSQFLHCVLVLDCCFSGAMAEVLDNPRFANARRGLTLIAACGPEEEVCVTGDMCSEVAKTQADWYPHDTPAQTATEWSERPGYQGRAVETRYSYFTGYFIEALAGGAADPLGFVTTLSAFQYVSEAMGSCLPEYTCQTGFHRTRPVLKAYTYEAVVLKRINHYLSDDDLAFLYHQFKELTGLERFFSYLPAACHRDRILRLSSVKKEEDQASVNRLLATYLIELKTVPTGKHSSTQIYRLTGRGRHYWDMIHHQYFLGR